MNRKTLFRTLLLCVGISGFIMVSLGIVLLVSKFPTTFLTIGLIVFGTGQLVFFCFPNQGERTLFNIILLNLSMVFLSISGLISYPQAEEFLRVTGILCFSLGLLINAVCNAFLVLWIISETSYGKQDSNNKLFDEYLDAIIQAKLLKYRNKLRND